MDRITKGNEEEFGKQWVEAWNSHDLERILSHYTEDVEITTPMIREVLGTETGTLCGKEVVGEYWSNALQKMPDLQFKLLDVTASVDSIAVYYESVLGKRCIEVMFFDASGKVCKMIAHYTK